MKKVPVVPPVKDVKKAIVLPVADKDQWLFSFKEFDQLPNFGLSGLPSSWFASLLGQLKALSKMNLEDFRRDGALRQGLRYHAIDWEAKSIPIQREDLNWISKDILNNPEEFEFFQFHISKALGRVVGYWQPLNVFNIVLFDPMHNMQPSSYNDYKIRYCSAIDTDISSLLQKIERIKEVNCTNVECQVKTAVMSISMVQKEEGNAVIFFLDDDFLYQLKELEKSHSLTKILESGIFSLTR